MGQPESVQLPAGFRFAGVTAGIKPSGKPDLALVVTERPTVAAAVLTTNLIHAASIDWCRSILPSSNFRGVVINSGNANACTGEAGAANNRRMAEWAAESIGALPQQIAVLSTGIIGRPLPMDALANGIPQAAQALACEPRDFLAAARAITTTDNAPKHGWKQFQVAGQSYTIAVMAKGAGMIGPNMATMLCLVVTDFPLNQTNAVSTLKIAADQSFNAISVEGHMSTNDAMVLMTSAGIEASTDPGSLEVFQEALNQVTLDCAKLIPIDGEGATHLVRIQVRGAANRNEADLVARSIANSALVKTAIYGNDPNWGRIVSAAGYAGVSFQPEETSLQVNGFELFRAGTPLEFDETQVSHSMKNAVQVDIELTIGSGTHSATHWTSDLTVDYVRFNSDYST